MLASLRLFDLSWPLIALISDACVSIPLTWASFFLPSFMDITPTGLCVSLMVPGSSVWGLLPPVHLDFVHAFFFHLHNCKSNKSINTLPALLHLPHIHPSFPTDLPCHCGGGGEGGMSTLRNVTEPDPLVLYVVTVAVDVVWPPSLDCSLSFTGSPFSFSRSDSLRCFNLKILDSEKRKSETDLGKDCSKSNSC